MKEIKNNIVFRVSLNTKLFVFTTYEGEYRNLMMLLSEKLCLEDFGECKGIGRCGTCHIKLINPSKQLLLKEGNENSTLSKHGLNSENIRLACQILIDDSINGILIKIEL